MSKKRDVKDLEFLSEENSNETKDINDKLFSNSDEEIVNKNEEKKIEEEEILEEENEISNEKDEDNSSTESDAVFGDSNLEKNKKEEKPTKSGYAKDSDNNKKKWIWISIITFIVLLIIAGIIVGSLALAGVFDKEGESGLNDGTSMDDIGSWIESQDNENSKINDAIEILTDRAVIYYYDLLGENNYLFDKNQAQAADYKSDVERQAKKRVENEKDSYDDDTEWDKNLVSLGFSTAENGGEEQYIDSIVGEELKAELDKTLTSGDSIYEAVYLTNDISTYNFASTEEVYDGFFAVLPNGEETETAFNNHRYFDTEALFNLYLTMTKPISFNEIFVPLTSGTYEDDHGFATPGGVSSTVNFSSNADLETFYYLINDISEGELDFESNESTNSGIISMNDFVVTSTSTDTEGETETETSSIPIETYDEGDGTEGTESIDGEVALIDALFNSSNTTSTAISGLSTTIESVANAIALDGTVLSLNDIQNLNSTQLQTVGDSVYVALSGIFGSSTNISFKLTNTSAVDGTDSLVIYSLQADGMHFYELVGSESVTWSEEDWINTMGKNIIDEDLTNSYKNLESFDKRVVGIYDSFTSWVESNSDLLLINSAYEYNAPLLINEEYGWENDMKAELGDDWLVKIEQAIYGDPAIDSFINFRSIVDTYDEFVKGYEDKGVTLEEADFTPIGTSDYDTLRNGVTYYQTALTYDADALESWNYFMINYSDKGYGVAQGAIETNITLNEWTRKQSTRGSK